MGQKNLEIVREMYQAFNRGDAETGLRLLHPEPELHQDPEVVDAETYIGLAAFVRGMILFTDEWDNPRLEPQDADAIGDFVFIRVQVSGVGKATRLEMTTQFFHAWTFRDGKPWRCFVRSTREEALKAVGLAAQPISANVDLVRPICADWERGDFSVVDWAPPDIEYSIVGGLESGRWWGVRAMTERSREQLREFDHFRIEVDGCREVDDERVLVLWRFRGAVRRADWSPQAPGPIC